MPNRDEVTGKFVAKSEKEKLEEQIREAQARLGEIKKAEAEAALAERRKAEEEKAAVRKTEASKVDEAYKKFLEAQKLTDEAYKAYLVVRNEFVKKYGYYHQSFTTEDGRTVTVSDFFQDFQNLFNNLF